MSLRERIRSLARFVDPWAPPLALMAVIFFFSAQPDLSSGLGTIDLVGRKLIHATEYGLLAALWFRALRTVVTPTRALGLAFAVAVAYAGSDELHQTFVEGRHGTPIDVAIDATGTALALFAIHRGALAMGRRR